MTRPVFAGLAIAAATLFALATPGGVQAVEAPGVLVVSPGSGDLDTPLDVATVGVCERGTTVMVTVDGKGITGDGDEIIVGAIDWSWLDPNGYPSHQVSLSQTLSNYFFRAQVPKPKGDYTLTFICRNRLDVEPLQTFTATLSIDAKGRYEVQGDSALDLDAAFADADLDYETVPGTEEVVPVEPDEGAGPDDPGQADGGAAPTSPDSSDAGNSDVPGSEGAGPDSAASPEVTEAAAVQESSSDSLRGTLLIVGALLLAVAMSAWIIISRREKRASS